MQIFKRSGSPYYYARWQFNGLDNVVSTKKKTKPEAEAELKRLVAENKGSLTIEDQLQTLQRLLSELPSNQQFPRRQEVARAILSGQEQRLSIAHGWQTWRELANKEYEPKQKTLNGYEAIWTRFNGWAEGRKFTYLHELTPAHTEDYAGDLWKSKVSPTTYNAHVKFLRSAFGALQNKAGLVSNPWTRLKMKKKMQGEGRRNLTAEELQTVLSKAQGNRKLLLSIGLFTGLRLGDVVGLRWENIDHDPFTNESKPGFIVVLPLKVSRYGKQKRVELPIHRVLRELITAQRTAAVQALAPGEKLDPKSFLFPTEQAEYSENPANITKPMQEFFNNCGITTTQEAEHEHRRRNIIVVGFHSLRHSFVSLAAKAGAQQHVIQKLVGHGSPMMTDLYTHLDNAQKCSAIDALPDFSEGAKPSTERAA